MKARFPALLVFLSTVSLLIVGCADGSGRDAQDDDAADDDTADDDAIEDDEQDDDDDDVCYNPPQDPLSEAFLPIGVYYCWPGQTGDEQTDREHFRSDLADLAAHGVDYVVATFMLPRARIWFLEEADAAGIRVMMGLQEMQHYIMLPEPLDPDEARRLAEELTMPLRELPALHGYYIADEPDIHDVIPENLAVAKQALEEVDPLHPSFACLAVPFKMKIYFDAMQPESMMTDVYPIWAFISRPGNFHSGLHIKYFEFHLEYVSGIAGDKPVWLVAQAFGCGYPWRKPIFEELRAMVLMSLNRDYEGIIYFIYQSLVDGYGYTLDALIDFDGRPTELYERMTEFHEQLTPIKNALLRSNPIAPLAFAQPVFDLGSFRHELGFHYVMAVNKDVLNQRPIRVEIPKDRLPGVEAVFDEVTGERIPVEPTSDGARFDAVIDPGNGRLFRICTPTDR